MARNEIKNKKVKGIFEEMEYDENLEDGCDLAWAWLKQREYKFLTPSCGTKNNVKIKCNNKEVNIEVSGLTKEDFEKIITESQKSLKEWTNLTGIQKLQLFNKLVAEIERYSPLICQLEIIMDNILCKDTKCISIPMIIDYLQYYAGWACIKDEKLPEYEPYGVCGYLILHNSPLALLTSVIAPALAAGNVMIIYCDVQCAPYVFLFQQLCETVGFPKGIININTTRSMKDCILNHKSVNKISYISEENFILPEIKSLTTLHFGYSPLLVFDTADLDSACDSVVDAAWACRGLLPWAITKVLVQETVFETFLEKLTTRLNKLSVGYNATLKKTDVIVPQKASLKDLFKINNIQLIIGNENIGGNILGNNYDRTLTILSFRTANEASSLANNTKSGLAASVWTENINLANEIACKLKVGIIWINSHGFLNANSPFSIMKKSGKGYFGGKEGLMEYLKYSTTTKSQQQKSVKNKNIISRLPGPISQKRIYLYYGGAFKKSESGLTEDYAEFPNKKDIRNCVESALKAQNLWSKLLSKGRSVALHKLASRTETIQNSSVTTMWTDILYEWAIVGNSITFLNVGFSALKTIREPLGVVAFELPENLNLSVLKLIISALSVGNSVIIINKCDELEQFLNDVCIQCNLPSGVFNVINNPNDEVINTVMGHQEIHAYFKEAKDDVNISSVNNICNMKNVNMNSNEDILNLITRSKSIWASVGESFL